MSGKQSSYYEIEKNKEIILKKRTEMCLWKFNKWRGHHYN